MNCLPLLATLLPAIAASGKVYFFIGTYTSDHGSKGIYEASLDRATGIISLPTLVAETSNPSYLALSPDGSRLYAANEDTHGTISAYRVESVNKLEFLNTQAVQGAAPCYVSVDSTGKNVLCASYGVGVVSCIPIKSDGGLAKPSSVIQSTGIGPDKSRQDSSHMHWIAADSRSKFVYSCDLGTDKVQVYSFAPKLGVVEELPGPVATTPPGSGARHGAFSPNHRFLYVNGEMGNSVTVFEINEYTGGLKAVQTIRVLTSNDLTHGKTTAEIVCHPNGKWLYVSNRGDDSITVFKILSSGLLQWVEMKDAGVKVPRGFAIDAEGKWLVVAGQGSHDLVSFLVDRLTGKLTPKSHIKAVTSPVCVVFQNR